VVSCHYPDSSAEASEASFQQRFSVNIWAANVDDYVIGPCIIQDHLGGQHNKAFLEETLPVLRVLEDVPLHVREGM
jgi:hypothetical protein